MQTFKSARGASQINSRSSDDIVCILFALHNHNHFHLVWVDAENNKNSGNLHYSHRLGAALMPTTTNYGKIRPRGDDRKCEIESRRHARRNFNFFFSSKSRSLPRAYNFAPVSSSSTDDNNENEKVFVLHFSHIKLYNFPLALSQQWNDGGVKARAKSEERREKKLSAACVKNCRIKLSKVIKRVEKLC